MYVYLHCTVYACISMYMYVYACICTYMFEETVYVNVFNFYSICICT